MVTLTNIGTAYDGTPASKGLGAGDFDLTGATSILFRVRVNKIGTGTQSWQLWNDTDASEIGVINDAAAAGDSKNLSVSIPISLTGIKTLRVRGKSTVAADDPVFYWASILVIKP
jgi:hypothetical protein